MREGHHGAAGPVQGQGDTTELLAQHRRDMQEGHHGAAAWKSISTSKRGGHNGEAKQGSVFGQVPGSGLMERLGAGRRARRCRLETREGAGWLWRHPGTLV